MRIHPPRTALRPPLRGGGLYLAALTIVVIALPALLLVEVPRALPVAPDHAATPPAILGAPGATDTIPPQRQAVPAVAVTSRPASALAGKPTTLPRPRSPSPSLPPLEAIRPPGSTEGEWDRSARRDEALRRYGGNRQTEDAVSAGLAWLAAHQSANGTWDRLHFELHCPPDDRCGGAAVQRVDDDLCAGLTGLALLAFLGAGCTHEKGDYPQVVTGAREALVHLQEPHGGFSKGDSMAGYNDALATLALAEYLALTGDERVRTTLERAVLCLAGSQQVLGGWDYSRSPNAGRNDTSITAWVVQALHACAAAGIEVPRQVLVAAALHLARAAEPDGQVRYSDAGAGFRLDDGLRPVYQYGPAMSAAGLTCVQLLGWRLDGPVPLAQRGRLLSDLPSAARARGRDPRQFHSEYYWYYGTLAMFQRGGADWERWNAHLRDAVLPLQERQIAGAKRTHAYGSWPPYGNNWGMFGRMGGRVYTTAICTLTLEIYYRHTPAYLTEDIVFSADDWHAYLRGLHPRDRLTATQCLAQLRVEVSEPVLVELLDGYERRVNLAAAEALAVLDSPLGVPLLERVVSTIPPWERLNLEAALVRGKALLERPPVEGQVRYVDRAAQLATVELPRSFVGMQLELVREGHRKGALRVIQRFTGRSIAVVAWSAETPMPLVGDAVVSR